MCFWRDSYTYDVNMLLLQLGSVLNNVLVDLLLSTNNNSLRELIIPIITNITRRVKDLHIQLPVKDLLDRLVCPQHMPYACNLAIYLVEVSTYYISFSTTTPHATPFSRWAVLFRGDLISQRLQYY